MTILNALDSNDAEMGLVFVSDRKMRELNRQYRNIDKPTDVLSFSAREADGPEPDLQLGDVIISTETAMRQAKENGLTFAQEMDRLLVHGVLHLHGYDHQKAADSRKMKSKERWLLKKLAE